MKSTVIVTNKELIADLRRVKTISKRNTLARSTYRSLGNHASSTVEEHYGTWSRAKKVAGIR
jgi:hypothetical protein